jgi:hypothetical protein
VTVFDWIGTITLIALLFLSMWWCLRQYYRARRKGYYPMLAATVVFGGAFLIVIAGIALLDAFWYGRATMVVLLLFPVPALVVTVLVALLPRRPRRAGERRSLFLFVAFGVAVLGFARERLGTPGLAETVTADTRPAVLYLREFQQESNPFAWVDPQEHSRYTRRPQQISNSVTFEQYFGAEFASQLGPFVALGNPLDSVPPEGAARSYAPDEDWQQHFCALAGAAAAIVMHGSRSDNLRWELAEITRHGWQRKLFLLTAPVPQKRGGRLLSVALRLAKGVRIPRWEQFAAELTEIGLHVPPTKPNPGSVLTFDAAGRAEVLIHGAQQPEEFVTAVRTRL